MVALVILPRRPFAPIRGREIEGLAILLVLFFELGYPSL